VNDLYADRLRGVFTTRRYTDPRLPLPLPVQRCWCQVMHLLRILSETTSQSITEIMEPHKDVLNEMIPPKKHLLRYQPANAQIGLMVYQLSSLHLA